MNILITGCNGQLGTHLRQREVLMPQHRFYNTDIAELDITDAQAVRAFIDSHAIDGIVNCAAYTAVDRAENDADTAHRINALAPELLAAAIQRRNGWMIHISTDYVFDGNSCVPYCETDTPNPTGVYGRTKLEGEQRVQKACANSVVLRTAWLYSEVGNNFVKTMLRLGSERDSLGVVYDQVGSPTYVGDLAQAIQTVIEQGIRPGTYHFTNEGAVSWYDFTKAIHRIAGIGTCHVRPLRSEEYPTPTRRPSYSVLDKAKFRQTYQVEIPYWEDSLGQCIAQLLKKQSAHQP